jgi:hypothetical protein
VPTFALLIAVLVIIGLFLIGGVFRYLRQELQETPEERRRNRRP